MSCCKLRVANFGKICRVNSSMRSLGCEETGGNAQIAARPQVEQQGAHPIVQLPAGIARSTAAVEKSHLLFFRDRRHQAAIGLRGPYSRGKHQSRSERTDRLHRRPPMRF
jgi:hypothetical protein